MNSTWILVGVGAALILALLLLGPAEQPSTDSAIEPPIASAEIYAEPASREVGAPWVNVGPDRTVGERETIRLAGEAAIPGGGAVTYLWTAEGGLGFFENAHSPTTAYTAPSACDCEESVILTLTAASASGQHASDSMILSVRDPLNCPEATYEACGAFVTQIDPCQAIGDEATCPAHPAEACATPCVTAMPVTGGCPEPPVPCPCVGASCEGGWTPGWPFGEQPAHPRDRAKPRIDPHYAGSINEGSMHQVEGYIANPACLPVCFTWSASKGWLERADTLQPIFHAPQSDRRDGETVTITLTVYDTSGGRSYDQIRVRIVNTDPT